MRKVALGLMVCGLLLGASKCEKQPPADAGAPSEGGGSSGQGGEDASPAPACGGIAARPCPGAGTCVDDPSDGCDPKAGGADCGGVCECSAKAAVCAAGSHWNGDPSVCACEPDAAGGGSKDAGSGTPAGAACGSTTCAAGQVCCNASCGICTAKGGACTQQACVDAGPVDGGGVPAGAACGSTTCAAGQVCCNASCGICTAKGGVCTQQLCSDDAGTAGSPLPGDSCDLSCDPGQHCEYVQVQCIRAPCPPQPTCVDSTSCGGFTGTPCPGSGTCKDDPSDSCDPKQGGADCGGICSCDIRALCVAGSHFNSSPAVCACEPD